MPIWILAWPIILSNITIPLLGLVDTAVVGHLSDSRYLAAVTLGATLLNFLYWGFGFLRMGTTGLVAQAMGREYDNDVRLLLGQSLILASVIGCLLILFGPALISLGLWLLNGSEVATPLAREYAEIRLWSAPAVLANYAILGWFLGQQNSRVTLMILVLTNSVNIVLNLWFVLGMGMTSNGVAWAGVIADYTALTFGGYLVLKQLKKLSGYLPYQQLFKLPAYAALFHVNSNLFVRTLGLLFVTAFFTAQGAQQGDTILAANAVLIQFIMLTSYALDGFAHAAESLVGKAYGRRDWRSFAQTVGAAARFSFWTAAAVALCFALGGHYLIAMLTGLAEVRVAAGTYLPWMVVMPLIAVWSYLLDGVFIGTSAVREMRNSIFIGIAIYLPSWWLLQDLGNHGLWLAFTLFMLVRSTVLLGYYRHYRQTQWRPSD